MQASTTRKTICYNATGLKEIGSKVELAKGFRLWIDTVDPTNVELLDIQKEFSLDVNAINLIKQKVKRPQSRILDNYLFSIILDIQYKTLKQLTIEGIYMLVGKDWLITLHSSNVDLISPIKHMFEQKNRKLKDSNIDALYYTIISEVI